MPYDKATFREAKCWEVFMTGIEGLEIIKDKDYVDNIQELTKLFVEQINPSKVMLFGSFAKGSYTDESDYDFYIVVDDERDVRETTRQARRASIDVKKRPVDIIVGTNSRFEAKRKVDYTLMVEGEVERDGILLYERN